MQTQVVPQYVNQPKRQGGKFGNIKLQDGTLYMVPVNMLGSFAPGVAANIDYQNQTWGQGQDAKQVSVVTAINGQNITGQAGPVRGGDRPAPTPPNVPQSDKEEGMFIMGVVGRAMGSGQFSTGDIAMLTKCAAQAWRDRHTPYPEAPPDDSYGLTPPPGNPLDSG